MLCQKQSCTSGAFKPFLNLIISSLRRSVKIPCSQVKIILIRTVNSICSVFKAIERGSIAVARVYSREHGPTGDPQILHHTPERQQPALSTPGAPSNIPVRRGWAARDEAASLQVGRQQCYTYTLAYTSIIQMMHVRVDTVELLLHIVSFGLVSSTRTNRMTNDEGNGISH